MDKSQLARLMLEWEEVKRRLDYLEAHIRNEVLQLQESQKVGNVKATYYTGRRTYDYEAACEGTDDALVEAYTIPKVDWRSLALEGIGLEQEEIPFKESQPSVSLKLLD